MEYLHNSYIGTTPNWSSSGSDSSTDSRRALAPRDERRFRRPKKVQTPVSTKRPPLDRVSRGLKNGKSVSASLNHVKAESDGLQFAIYVAIDSGGGLQWPVPAWVDALLVSIATEDMKVKQKNSYQWSKKPRRRMAPVPLRTDIEREEKEKGIEEEPSEVIGMAIGRSESEQRTKQHHQPISPKGEDQTENSRRSRRQEYDQHQGSEYSDSERRSKPEVQEELEYLKDHGKLPDNRNQKE